MTQELSLMLAFKLVGLIIFPLPFLIAIHFLRRWIT